MRKLNHLQAGIDEDKTKDKTKSNRHIQRQFIMPLVVFYCQGKTLFIAVVHISFGFEFVHIESSSKVNCSDVA